MQKNIELAYLFTIMLIWSLVSPKKLTKILHENFLDVANYISYGKKLKLPKISCFFGNIQLAYLFTIMFHMVPSITEKITTNIFIYSPIYHKK